MPENPFATGGRIVDRPDAPVPSDGAGTPGEVAASIAFLASDEVTYPSGSADETTGTQEVRGAR